MKKIILSALSLLLILGTLSLNAQNNVSLEIVHALGTKAFAFGTESETPESVQFDLHRLEYYMSEITLVHDGGQEIIVPDVWVLANASESSLIDLGSLSIDELEGLRFSIGVDPEHNNLDPSTYDPSHPLAHKNPSMHWGWTAGYRFVAMEGNGGPQFDQLFEIHALGNKNYFEVDIPITMSAENGDINPVIYGNYSNALAGINVSSGVISHGEVGEAVELLENFRDLVFTTTSPIDTTAEEEEEPNGISELASGFDFQLYPNPSVDGNTMLNTSSSSTLNITVFDLTGKQVYNAQLDGGNQALNISSLESGVYFVRVNDLVTNEMMVKKLSVQ